MSATRWILAGLGGCLLAAGCNPGDGGWGDDDLGLTRPGPGSAPLCATAAECNPDSCCYQGGCEPSTPSAPGPCLQPSDCPAGQSCNLAEGLCIVSGGGAGGSGTAGSSGAGAGGGGVAGGGTTTGGAASGATTGGVPGGSAAGGSGGAGSGTAAPGACQCNHDLSQVPVGSPCQGDADCGPNGVCQPPLDLSNGVNPTVWTGGYCTALNCNSSCECPAGSECFFYPVGGTPDDYSLCLADCGTASCRRPGYTCSAVGDPMEACLPECSQDGDCGPNLVCEAGTCAPPCHADSDCGLTEICANGHCQAGPPVSCCECEPCPQGLACVNGECVVSCRADVDCPAGERCGSSDSCG